MRMRLMEFADFTVLAICPRSADQQHLLGICCFLVYILVESLLTRLVHIHDVQTMPPRCVDLHFYRIGQGTSVRSTKAEKPTQFHGNRLHMAGFMSVNWLTACLWFCGHANQEPKTAKWAVYRVCCARMNSRHLRLHPYPLAALLTRLIERSAAFEPATHWMDALRARPF